VKASIIGAGVAGLVCALELADRGIEVEVFERTLTLGASACSWYAGGMLAPWCERENSEPLVAQLGEESVEWWLKHYPGTVRAGTIVVAHPRDDAELSDFARRTQGYERLDREQLAALEPDLAERFSRALHFASEAHLNPREAMTALAERLVQQGVPIHFGVDVTSEDVRELQANERVVVNCTGLEARSSLPDLRGVKGEMVLLRLKDISLTRPVRVLHARLPLYIVPRADGLFMVGATMIESDEPKRISARSLLELLTAAYALNPAFGEAEVVEIGTGVRPAFLDNMPRLRWRDGVLHVNGLYRHGFLMAPALARRAAEAIQHERSFPEVMDEDHRERRRA
jgi:glycine oxidase